MPRIPIERSQDYMGCLTVIGSGEKLEIELMDFDKESKENISQIVNDKTITKDNQNLFIKQLSMPIKDGEKFANLQSMFTKEGNKISLLSTYRNTPNYNAKLTTLITINGEEHVCEVNLGNIHFDFINYQPTYYEDYIEFSNITATVFSGTNSAIIIE